VLIGILEKKKSFIVGWGTGKSLVPHGAKHFSRKSGGEKARETPAKLLRGNWHGNLNSTRNRGGKLPKADRGGDEPAQRQVKKRNRKKAFFRLGTQTTPGRQAFPVPASNK